jgi:hypothetical protein
MVPRVWGFLSLEFTMLTNLLITIAGLVALAASIGLGILIMGLLIAYAERKANK